MSADPPPHDLDAETAVLGAILIDPPRLTQLRTQGLTPRHFYKPLHAAIYSTATRLADDSIAIDPVIIADELDDLATPADLIGLVNVAATKAATPAVANIIIEHARRRDAMAAAYDIIQAARDGDDWTPALEALTEQDHPATTDLELNWVRDVLATPPEEPPVLVEGFLRQGELCVIGAPRAIGKSWLVMNLAALLSRGEGKLLGKLEVRHQVPVLISQGELGQWNSWSRWQKLTGQDGPPELVAETFDRWRLRIAKKRRTTKTDMEEWYDAILDPRLERSIEKHGFRVLIIDPWATYYAGNANDNDQAEKALDKLRDLALRYQVAVVIMHHISGKIDAYNKEPEDLWRGATRLADWASTRVTILPHYKTEKARLEAGLTRQVARWHVDIHFLRRDRATDDFSAVWDPRTGWWDHWVPTETSDDDTPSTRLAYANEEVLGMLRDAGGDWPSANKAAEAMGTSYHTARDALERAERAGLIESYKRGRITGYRIPSRNIFASGVPLDAYEHETEHTDDWGDF